MLKKVAAAVLTAAVFSSAVVAADYYVVQEKSTMKCKVVETRPTDKTIVVIGDKAYVTKDEATKQVAIVCKEKM